ncbi:hypothetical protein, partial [Neisseria meningitidis]|uniref:hypothetical protein n=1 Tax=Neisseria meningitidis TaxID=487 RepID=UPI001C9A1D73
FGFSCFWVSGNFQIVIPAQAGIQTIGQRQYSKIIRKFEVLDSRFHGNDERWREFGLFGFGFFFWGFGQLLNRHSPPGGNPNHWPAAIFKNFSKV